MKVSLPSPARHRAMQWSLGALATAAIVSGATLSAQALAQPPGGHGPHGPGSDMMMFDGHFGAMAGHVDRMLDGLGTTLDQRARIRQITMAAEADLKAQRDAGRGLRGRAAQIFTAPTVDAAAAESLRQQMAAQQDHASRRVLDALLEIAKVLTPEQRAKIGARMQERQAIAQDRRQRMEQHHRSQPLPPDAPKP